MKFHSVEQGGADWHALRRRCVGASDVAPILGLNPKTTPYMLFEQKLGLSTVTQTAAMKQGHEIEDEARAWFHREYGRKVLPAVATHDVNNWVLASFDGIDEANQVIVEIKHVKQEFHEMACAGKVPDLYFPQCQWQMYVSGWENVHYLSYKRGNPAVVIVPRDNDFIAMAVPKCKEFWDCVDNLTPPELTERDYVDVSDDVQLLDMVQRYKYYSALAKEYEGKRDEIKEQIKEAACDRNVKGNGFKVSRYPVKGRLDYAAIMSHHNIDVENCQQFKKTSTVAYRITIQ